MQNRTYHKEIETYRYTKRREEGCSDMMTLNKGIGFKHQGMRKNSVVNLTTSFNMKE